LRESLPDRAAVDLPGSWRIGITSAFPYSGTTTLVGILGLVLAGARGESVLALDLCPSVWPDEEPEEPRGDPLCPRVGLAGDVTVADVARRRGSAAAGLRTLLHASGDTTPALEVVPLSRSQAPASGNGAAVVPADDTVTPGMLRTALGQLTRAYPLVLVDAPVAAPLSPTALRAADLIVVVSLAAPADLDRTAAALRDPAAPLLPVDKNGRRPPVIVAVVSPRRGRWSPRTRAAAGRLARHVDTIVRIPYESRLDPSKRAPIRIPRLRASTRRSYLRLGVAVVESLLRLAAEETVKTHATAADSTRGSTPETLRTPVV
jgi:cellulose biosynthesis protein BcsQ